MLSHIGLENHDFFAGEAHGNLAGHRKLNTKNWAWELFHETANAIEIIKVIAIGKKW